MNVISGVKIEKQRKKKQIDSHQPLLESTALSNVGSDGNLHHQIRLTPTRTKEKGHKKSLEISNENKSQAGGERINFS